MRRASPETPEEPAILRRLSARDLLVAGLTSGQIGIAAPAVFGAWQAVNGLLPKDLVERVSEVLLLQTVVAALLLVLARALFAWALAVFGTVLAHAGFTLSRSPDGKYLYIKRGLLERHEATVPLARIQAIKVVEGVLRRPLGLATLRVESAGFGAEEGVSTTLFPPLPRKEIEELLRVAAPRFASSLGGLKPLPIRAQRRYARRAALPIALISAPCAVLFFPWGLVTLLLALPAALYGLLRYTGQRVTVSTASSSTPVPAPGVHDGRRPIVPWGRLQSRGYSVSPLQRRKGLATFKVEVASGSGAVAFRLADAEAALAVNLIERLGPGIPAG